MMNNELIPTPMMSFGESVKTCFQKYVTFKGRARRSEYWWFCLLNFIVSIVTLVLDYQMDTINIELGLGALLALLLCQRLCSRGEPIRQEPKVRTGDILTSNDRFGLQPKTVESTLRRVVAPPLRINQKTLP